MLYTNLRPLILASGSPRRKELLAQVGVSFSVVPSSAEEPPPEFGEEPVEYAERMSRLKGSDVYLRQGLTSAPTAVELPVLAADTIVAVAGRILGKPQSKLQAREMLKDLSGVTHTVVTGVALFVPHAEDPASGAEMATFHAATQVRFIKLTDALIEAYLATDDWRDKAGSYGIQGLGAAFVEHVEGSYTNVVGLPLARVLEVLVSWDVIDPKQG